MKKIRSIAVIGSGTMGSSFAQLFGSKDIKVNLIDTNTEILDKARLSIQANLDYMVELDFFTKETCSLVNKNVFFFDHLEDGLKDVDLVLEAVYENLELKQNLFVEIEALVPSNLMIASNTSSFDINELNIKMRHKERFIGTHFFFPPMLTPCVEVIPSDVTDEKIVVAMIEFLESIGKAPARCKSGPGFVANRIQYAMAGEALRILEEGIATAEDIDKIVRTSFGFRLGAYGPMQVIDLAGVDIYDAIWNQFYEKFPTDVFKPPQIIGEMTKRGELGLKSGQGFYQYSPEEQVKVVRERDKRLIDRLKLFEKENKK
jgi:3-hydroxybutyryl-CoA dehydrogenase